VSTQPAKRHFVDRLWRRKAKALATAASADPVQPPARRAGDALPVTPFHLASCTLLIQPTAEEQEAFTSFFHLHQTRAAFWERAPYSDWMLDMLRGQFDRVPVAPEAQLRRFALECVSGLKGADMPAFLELLAAVRRRASGELPLIDLRRLQRQLHSAVTSPGVQGLPRCLPHAAGMLAAWHTASGNPYDAAFWAAEFAALHDTFVALQKRATGWAWPEDRGEAWRESWRAAFFDRAHPDVRQRAMQEARERQAVLLRRILPQPFVQEVRARRRPS
jgi:hypothetical protein